MAQDTRETVKIGEKMLDGSIYAGLTDDGKHQIFAMPADLDAMTSFNKAAQTIEQLNAEKTLGHDDWRIPTRKQLRVLSRNRDKGALKDTFCTGGNIWTRRWYLSRSEMRYIKPAVLTLRLSHDKPGWVRKDDDGLSCRPVRLMASV